MTNVSSTDAYKIAMAQAGFPLREETFYLSFRKGGWQFIPFDLVAEVKKMLPKAKDISMSFLEGHGYNFTPAMVESLTRQVQIRAAPPKSWVYEREPILTVTGPSFVVSWLEARVLRLFFPIQLATEIVRGSVQEGSLRCACDEQLQIVRRVIYSVAEDQLSDLSKHCTSQPDHYAAAVQTNAEKLLELLIPSRIFEVGMRSATCEEQHDICLRTLKGLGIDGTSNTGISANWGLIPVGTMGHEHVQRWGDDLSAFRAMRDMRKHRPTYLLDTFNTITRGIPAAIQVMREDPHDAAVRYDSGDKFGQYIFAHGEFQRYGLEPVHVLEDGLDLEATAKFEFLRKHTGLSPDKQVYGYGGFLVSGCWDNPLTRDRVAAVYKLSSTSGEARMKFGNEAGLGKISVPGCPTIWRRLRGGGPISIIAQVGETLPEDYVELLGNPEAWQQLKLCNAHHEPKGTAAYMLSPETQRLVATFQTAR